VGEADLPATWSHPDSLEADIKGRYIVREWLINERLDACRLLQSRISRASRCYCTNHIHFLTGCQHWWLGVALTSTVGLPMILITVTQKQVVQWTAQCSM
jgi:hypothetical protein